MATRNNSSAQGIPTHHSQRDGSGAEAHNAASGSPLTFRTALVLGCQKAGSTLLHAVLLAALRLPPSHPAFRKKETHFFENEYCEYDAVYRCRSEISRKYVSDGWFVDGTPDNFQNANVWGVLHRVLPTARLLVTLRDPIDRAYSSWNQNAREAKPTGDGRSFDAAVLDELRDLWRRCTTNGEHEGTVPSNASRLALDVAADIEPWYVPNPASSAVRPLIRTARAARCAKEWRGTWLEWRPEIAERCGSCKQYLVRGFVVRKLDAWRKSHDGDVLVFAMEGVAADPVATASRIRDFLGLPAVRWGGEALEKLRQMGYKQSWHGRRLGEVPSWSEGVLTELYRDEVRQLRTREPAVVELWPRWAQQVESS